MIRRVTLLDLLDQYALEQRLAASTISLKCRIIRMFSRHVGHESTPADLDDQTVSHWLEACEADRQTSTCRCYRAAILTHWRYCADCGLCQYPGRVRLEPKPDPNPIAWTAEEFRQILATCATLWHRSRLRVPISEYFTALYRTAYETGLRCGDLQRIRKDQITASGQVVGFRQAKTGHIIHCQVGPETLRLLRTLAGDCPLHWPGSRNAFYYWLGKIIKMSCVRPGAMQQARRTGATQIAIATGEDTAKIRRYLGHTGEAMQKHYVDRSQLPCEIVTPPQL